MSLDKATIARLLVREHDKVAAYVWLLVRDDHLVDDVLQDLALLAIRKCDEIKDEAHFLAWMRVSGRHLSLDVLKRRHRRPHLLGEAALDLVDAQWAAYDSTPSADLSEALRICLGKLSPYARRLVQLRYVDGLKSARVAQLLKRNSATVYVALTRVHQKLAGCIQSHLSNRMANG